VLLLSGWEVGVWVWGVAGLGARKLRYFEDRRFTARLAEPPALGGEVYADRPPQRGDDWAGLRAEPVALAAEGEAEELGADGSLQQQRHPGLAVEEQRLATVEARDPLGLGEDEDDSLAAAPLLARMRPLAPVVAADAINQGSDRGSDLIPSFGG
jgi:type IV secretion system protein VirD4